MDHQNTDKREKTIEFMLAPENDSARVKIGKKDVSSELSSDFTLPDYMPEIRKLLKITPLISPVSRYISGNNVEFSGRVDYELLYAAGDGTITAAPLGTDFSFDVRLDMPDTMEWDDATDACADVSVDTLYCRVLAPRKVSVKCRLHSEVRAYGTEELHIEGINGSTDAEKLREDILCADFRRHVSEVFEISEEIPTTGSEETIRPIKCSAAVGVTEASPTDGGINCRGEVDFHVLYENKENNTLITDTKKVPFTQFLEASEVDGETLCRVRGICGETSVQVEEGRLIAATELILESDTVKNIKSSVTKDIFTVGATYEAEYRDIEHEKAEKCSLLSQTVIFSVPLADFSVSSEYNVVDSSANAIVNAITSEKGSTSLSGSCRLWLLSENGEEFSSAEVTLPFELGTDFYLSDDINAFELTAIPTVTDCRARVDGETAVFDVDMSVSYCIVSVCRDKIVKKVSVGEKTPCGSGKITVYYPQTSETLWDTAKKFRIPLKDLAEANDLPSFDGNESLAGKHFIIVSQ